LDFSYWANGWQTWDDVVTSARWAESAGWHGVWLADHFMPLPQRIDGRPPDDAELEPMLEAWTLLAGLAVSVPRVRLGTMVSGNTYRHPAVVVKMATTIDHMSSGRFVLGIGAGWQENEHRRYGIDLPGAGERSDRLEEACEIIHRLLREPRVDHDGRHYRLDGAPAAPKPHRTHMPIMVGGGGERRTLRTVARWADEWNAWGLPHHLRHKIDVLERHCAAVGRDPARIRKTAAVRLRITENSRQTRKLHERMGTRAGLVGTIDELRDRVADYEAAGIDEIVIADFEHPPDTRSEVFGRFHDEVVTELRTC